jgi:hypothetical protein
VPGSLRPVAVSRHTTEALGAIVPSRTRRRAAAIVSDRGQARAVGGDRALQGAERLDRGQSRRPLDAPGCGELGEPALDAGQAAAVGDRDDDPVRHLSVRLLPDLVGGSGRATGKRMNS